ncbi:HDOD domain-containing protein [Candidatus Sumerlaeota bacterium]|nr:HDOD domain-containing protein [Candidatus Sumerlaeota bacterium]
MISVEELKRIVQEIPPLPDIALRLIKMCQDASVAPRDIVEVIKHDPSITVKVLRLCNSTFYGLPRRITSLQEAMVYVGTDALVNFVLAGCLSTIYQKENRGYGLEEGQLWRHAVGCAICSQQVALKVDESLAGAAFTAGLLHDIGKIVMSSFVADEFLMLLDLVEREGISFLEGESRLLGYTHAEAGAEIAENWSLPEELVEAIRYHHEPQKAESFKKTVYCAYLGNILCVSLGIGVGHDGLATRFDPAITESLGLDPDNLLEMAVAIHDQFKKAEGLLAIP